MASAASSIGKADRQGRAGNRFAGMTSAMLHDASLYRRLLCADCWHFWWAVFIRDDVSLKRCPVHQPESCMERPVRQG